MSLNKVMLIGNLTADPEVRFTQNGTAVANVRIATNERWTDQSGEKQEKTEYHRLVIWGKQAEIAGEYLRKGRQIYAEGSLQTREWEKDGDKRYTTEIKVFRFQMLGGPGGNGGESKSASNDDSFEAPMEEHATSAPAAAASTADPSW